MASNEQFIDAESDYGSEDNSYEKILNRQLQNTADALSTGKMRSSGKGKGDKVEMSPWDTREIAINSVKTLRGLIQPFIKDKFQTDLETIDEDIKTYLKDEGEKEKTVPGIGKVKIKNLMHDSNSLEFHRYFEFLKDKHREIFNVLVLAYHKSKREIASFSTE